MLPPDKSPLAKGEEKDGKLLSSMKLKVGAGTNYKLVYIKWDDEIEHKHLPKRTRVLTYKQNKFFGDGKEL